MFGESVSVMEGDSVTLHTDVTEIHDDILWTFGAEKYFIAKINKQQQILSTFNGTDGRFRDRLKLDNQTGSLTITNITTEHAGLYKVDISGVKLISRTFSVSVYGEYGKYCFESLDLHFNSLMHNICNPLLMHKMGLK